MDNTPSTSLQSLFYRQQNLASKGIDCLVALDPTELRVAEPLVAEAGDENPLQGTRPAFEFCESLLIDLISLAGRVP